MTVWLVAMVWGEVIYGAFSTKEQALAKAKDMGHDDTIILEIPFNDPAGAFVGTGDDPVEF